MTPTMTKTQMQEVVYPQHENEFRPFTGQEFIPPTLNRPIKEAKLIYQLLTGTCPLLSCE